MITALKWILIVALAIAGGCCTQPKQKPTGEQLCRQAEVAVAEKRYDEAITLYCRIGELVPEGAAMSAVRIADILMMQGQTQEAIQQYQLAVERHPRGAMRYGAYDRLDELNRTH